ncbi:MAG: ABC transporter ATP-binding protein [cyanobacterium endosymbiont of Rhopalodia musculus]|uniref:ABC transporter ATP-binding protein n=1 Tax=cyanobacterium endosymbiont of Epithemia clementina EcSB TaxID=3034674 RepID=UPI00248031BA|nr:ABC transporter ATP-binding protein [cyanobacterium endosymbiont of Epithemia clementina EcSB]WGT68337.1 ABC transporter ATP-binding protein [cyanobacterium endosymbiont of Epithemia clementina EcSB]
MAFDSLPFTQDTLNSLNKINEYHSIIIRLEKISKIYGSGDTTVHALNNVSLTIEKGESCAVMGASGSGKSTLMNIVGCLDRPTSGYYYLDSINVSGLQETQLAAIRNGKIGFVFQQFHLLPQMTALENVILPMVYAGIATQKRRERAAAALEKVGLGNRLHNKPNQLSGGQQQRVAIARAIVNNPLLLLADEPTGALDSQMTQEILSIFQELSDTGITLVIVTHESEVARHCQRTIWFRDGQICQN